MLDFSIILTTNVTGGRNFINVYVLQKARSGFVRPAGPFNMFQSKFILGIIRIFIKVAEMVKMTEMCASKLFILHAASDTRVTNFQ